MYRPDTSSDVQEAYDQKIRKMTEEERFLRGISLTHFSREMCIAGIKERHPDISPEELKIKIFDTIYGSSFSSEEKERIHTYLRMHPVTTSLI